METRYTYRLEAEFKRRLLALQEDISSTLRREACGSLCNLYLIPTIFKLASYLWCKDVSKLLIRVKTYVIDSSDLPF